MHRAWPWTVALLVAGIVVWGAGRLELGSSVDAVVGQVRAWGAWGVAGSIGLMIAHSFLPFPAEILACANAIVYGGLWGAVITWVGAMLGASITFALVRWLGRPFVARMVPAHKWQRMSLWSRERGAAALLTARLIPAIAFNLINYLAALSEIPWWTFLWTTALGILPLTILLSILGEGMLTMPTWAWVLLGTLALASWMGLGRGMRVPDRQ